MADLNKLITRVSTITEIKQLLTEIEMNNTDKISKVSDESVLNAINYAIAKIAQKQIKDTAILESITFPESASGTYLDKSASLYGGLTRLGASSSSTFVRVKGTVGTQYVPGINIFASSTGVQFETSELVTLTDIGWGYVPVRSINTGVNSNAPGQSITSVTPKPVGHDSCTNEYSAVGGRDSESDESFKIRIRSYPNLQAQNTLDHLLEIIRLYNQNVLRIFKVGSLDGKINIRIVLENGVYLTDSELANILEFITPYLGLMDSYSEGESSGLNLLNTLWSYVDMDFRVSISGGYTVDSVRQDIQVALTKYLDFRYWKEQSPVQWNDMLQIVKDTNGVLYVPDEFFTPASDITISLGELPRIRGFIMRDVDGTILFNSNSALTPIFYENGI